MSSRQQGQIDHILKFRCGYCGAEAGKWCRRFVRGTSRTKHMSDFHMARTQAAYPNDTRDAAGETPK